MNSPSSVSVLAKHGKSFYFAGVFLPKENLRSISDLYSFCRYVDDCADELHPEDARRSISEIQMRLQNPRLQDEIQGRISHLTSLGVSRLHLKDLVEGAQWDTENRKIQTEQDLDQYCYHVAGVVGLMMNPLMKVSSTEANSFAVDLGKAMQLTNICRDVLEDAQKGRLYLPLKHDDQIVRVLSTQGKTPQWLKDELKKYFDKAEAYYESGYQGLPYIPLRCRFVILLAGELYRSIGRKIARKNFEVLAGRIYLSKFEKLTVLFKTIPFVFKRRFWRIPRKATL